MGAWSNIEKKEISRIPLSWIKVKPSTFIFDNFFLVFYFELLN
jgi:hypothetical protein